MRQHLLACLAGLCLAGQPVLADDTAETNSGAAMDASLEGGQATAGELVISGGWARATLPGQKNGTGYLTIANSGQEADRLLSLSSPGAPRLQIHSMQVENDVMTMRPVEGGLEIPAGGTVRLAPGGLHLMFLGLPAPFTEGNAVEVELRFAKAGTVRLALPVRNAGGHAM